jgi:hypothetical protein
MAPRRGCPYARAVWEWLDQIVDETIEQPHTASRFAQAGKHTLKTTSCCYSETFVSPIESRASRRIKDDHEAGLAERLGLRSPFRLMQAKGFEDCALNHKRASSASSCLEPAMLPDPDPSLRPLTIQQPPRTNRLSGLRQSQASRLDNETEKASSDERSQSAVSPQGSRTSIAENSLASSVASAISPKYERRPRRRTREDRYELKEAGKRKKLSNEKEPENKKRKRRKCKGKTSVVILHDFSAENVEADRLTVRAYQCMPGGRVTRWLIW